MSELRENGETKIHVQVGKWDGLYSLYRNDDAREKCEKNLTYVSLNGVRGAKRLGCWVLCVYTVGRKRLHYYFPSYLNISKISFSTQYVPTWLGRILINVDKARSPEKVSSHIWEIQSINLCFLVFL